LATQNLAVGLLKPLVTPDQSLVKGHGLVAQKSSHPALAAARIFTRSRKGDGPWWVSYFDIPPVGITSGADAIVFMPVADRWMYLNFGFAYHKVENHVVEYDFGMRSAAVLVDPDHLRSTDSLEPNVGRRRRTQLPRNSEVLTFGMDARVSLVKGIAGKPKNTLNGVIKQLAGGAHLRLSVEVEPADLQNLLSHVLNAYLNDDVPANLKNYLQVRSVEDPLTLSALRASLISSVNARDMESASILVPETVDYGTKDHVRFTGFGKHPPFDDIYIGSLYEYLDHTGSKLDEAGLKRAKLLICDDEGKNADSYPLEKCIFFEAKLPKVASTFYFSDGIWYEVSDSLIKSLEDRLKDYFIDNDYPSFTDEHVDEAEYNKALKAHLPSSIILDKSDILPWTTSKIEPCDVAQLIDGELILFHVKRKTTSYTLSHLLNQGMNPWRAIRDSSEVRKKFLDLCENGGLDRAGVESALESKSVHIRYVITTHKNLTAKEKNLPIFSRISADRMVSEALDVGVGISFTYVSEPKEEKGDEADGEVVE
jgi:uncharacterized protein (TIGR04141 family)